MNARMQMHTKSNPTPVSSFTPVQSGLLQRKCACGSTAGLTGECAECRRKRLLGERLQTKLRVNQPGDRYEQEADRVAEQVMRMPDSEVGSVSPREEKIQRKCAACESGGTPCPKCAEEEEKIHLKPLASKITSFVQRQVLPGNTSEVTPQITANINTLRSGGQPLPETARSFFEPRFGFDFSSVRVHHGEQAAEASRAVNARAFSIGNDIVFGKGEFQPQTYSGLNLIAHELTHTIQQTHSFSGHTIQRQGAGITDPVQISPPLPDPNGEWATEKWLCEMRLEPVGSNRRLLALAATGPAIGRSVELLHEVLLNWQSLYLDQVRSGLPRSEYNNGEYREGTRELVKDFQRWAGVAVDGIVGPITIGKLDEFVGGPSVSVRCGVEPEEPIAPEKKVCKPSYDKDYGPSSSNCSLYSSSLAENWLSWTYRHNAACACEETPDNLRNNCVRKCLQVKLRRFLSSLPRGAVIPFDPLLPEHYCGDLHTHHEECYKECCCDKEFITYAVFLTMCEAPFPCFLVGKTIDWFNSCISVPNFGPTNVPRPSSNFPREWRKGPSGTIEVPPGGGYFGPRTSDGKNIMYQ